MTDTEIILVDSIETASKTQIGKHLKDEHYFHVHVGSFRNYSREELLDWHRKQHEAKAELGHEHREPVSLDATVGPEERALLEQAGLTRVLTIGEKKTLSELVENDYATLRSQINAAAEERWVAARDAIEAGYKKREKRIPVWEARLVRLVADYNAAQQTFRDVWTEKMRAFKEAAEVDGMRVEASQYERGGTPHHAPIILGGKSDDLEAAKKEQDEQRKALLAALETERLKTLRTITLASVPKEALTFLEQIPSAADVLTDVATQRKSAKAITAKED